MVNRKYTAMRFNNQSATKIGKGAFSTAYRVDGTDQVFILTKLDSDSNKYIKEIYTHIKKKHVPYMRTIGIEVYMPRVGYVNVYESRYYAPLTAKNKQAWSDYKVLNRAWDQVYYDNVNLVMNSRGDEYIDRHVVVAEFIERLTINQSVSQDIIDALDSIYTWATAFSTGFLFEFPKHNLRVDQDGNLILLDIVFFMTPTEDRKARNW